MSGPEKTWKLVPAEPTWEMQIAGRDAILSEDDTLDISTDDARAAYIAMLAASPAAPGAEVEPVAWGEFYGGRCAAVRLDRSVHCQTPLYLSPPPADAIRAQARREALEEAAKEMDRRRDDATGICSPRVTYSNAARAIRALAGKGEAEGWRPTHQHVKRGSTYRVIGEAEAQVSKGRTDLFGPIPNPMARYVSDGDKLTVYQGEDGKLWARFTEEFNDGRFVSLPAPSSAQGGGDAT